MKILIHEVLNESDGFNPFKQKQGIELKSPVTAAANAAAQAEFDRLDVLKKHTATLASMRQVK